MRITKLLLICMCCLIALPTLWAQAANSQGKPAILGYLDPHTGAFRPVPQAAAEDVEPFAATTFTGTVTLTITITLKTTSLTNITCLMETTVIDGSGLTSFGESDTVSATGTGTTRTCKLTIPYAWSLATQSNDSMTTVYSVSGSSGTAGLPNRTASRSPLDTRKVPANGAVTTLTASATL